MTRERGTDEARFADRAWRLVTENGSLKLVSLVIAVGVYTFLRSSSDAQRTIDIGVIPGGRPVDDSKVCLTQLPQRVSVTLQGPRALLDELPNPPDPIVVDLSKQPSLIRFDEIDFAFPHPLRKLHVNPPYLAVRWDVKVSKSVHVEAVSNAPREGFTLKNLVLEPSTVLVTGAKTAVDLVQKIRTTALDVSSRAAGAHVQSLMVDLLADPVLAGVKTDVNTVNARFEIVPETKTRTFTGISVLVLRGRGVTLRPRNVSVVATCSPHRADELTSDAIVPRIDLEALGADFAKKGPEEADVKAELPGCSEVTVSPPRVTVTR